MPSHDAEPPKSAGPLTGTAREFVEFSQRERRRRNNDANNFDPALFDEAVDYILHKLARQNREEGA